MPGDIQRAINALCGAVSASLLIPGRKRAATCEEAKMLANASASEAIQSKVDTDRARDERGRFAATGGKKE